MGHDVRVPRPPGLETPTPTEGVLNVVVHVPPQTECLGASDRVVRVTRPYWVKMSGHGRPRPGRSRPDAGGRQPVWFDRATRTPAAAKYLLVPRSWTVLIPNASRSFSASASLTPARA